MQHKFCIWIYNYYSENHLSKQECFSPLCLVSFQTLIFLIEFFFIVLSIYWSVSVKALVAQSCVTLCDPMDCSPTGSSVHWYSPGKYMGVSSLFQGIFATQLLNLDLLHCRHSHQEIVALRCFLSFYCTGKWISYTYTYISSFSLHTLTHIIMCCAVLSHSIMSDSLWPHGLKLASLLCPWGFSRQEHWSG